MSNIARRWTLIGVRNPSDSGTHVCVLVDEPPLEVGERVEVVPAETVRGAVQALEAVKRVAREGINGDGLIRAERVLKVAQGEPDPYRGQ